MPDTATPLRERMKDCWPRPMGTSKMLLPAGALKAWVLGPELTVSWPADWRRVTTKIESCMSCQPLGTPEGLLMLIVMVAWTYWASSPSK